MDAKYSVKGYSSSQVTCLLPTDSSLPPMCTAKRLSSSLSINSSAGRESDWTRYLPAFFDTRIETTAGCWYAAMMLLEDADPDPDEDEGAGRLLLQN